MNSHRGCGHKQPGHGKCDCSCEKNRQSRCVSRCLCQHADDFARSFLLGGANSDRNALAVLCRNDHHQLPDAPPPPDEPPPPEKPPPLEYPPPLLPEPPELNRMFRTTFRKNQRNPGETISKVTRAIKPAISSQLTESGAC